MQYGIFLPNFGPYANPQTLIGLARDAEAAGWDGFFLWDHIGGWHPRMIDPWIALAAIASNTTRLRLGPLITPLPRRRPHKVARETVSLDQLSGGRLTLGVGLGVRQAEWDHMGEETNLRTRGAMLDEALELITNLWSGEPITHSGDHYTIFETQFLPTPVQQPRIPIWVGGVWPNKPPFRRAARWDGIVPLLRDEGVAELDQLSAMLGYIRARRASSGPFDVVYFGTPTPADDPARGAEIVAAYAARGVTWWLENIVPTAFGVGIEDTWPLTKMRERVLAGPPRC